MHLINLLNSIFFSVDTLRSGCEELMYELYEYCTIRAFLKPSNKSGPVEPPKQLKGLGYLGAWVASGNGQIYQKLFFLPRLSVQVGYPYQLFKRLCNEWFAVQRVRFYQA